MMYLYISLGIVLFLVASILISMPIACNVCYRKFFFRGEGIQKQELKDKHYDAFKEDIYAARAEIEAMPFTELYCTAHDGVKLYAKYYDFGKDKTVILAHGARSLPLNNFSTMAKRFIEWGYNVLLPDQRGHGKSGGEIITYGYLESLDILEWIKLMRESTGAKIVLYGVSMGATCVAFASDKIKEGDVSVAVYDCGYASVGGMMNFITAKSHAPRMMMKQLRRRCERELGLDLDESTVDHLKNTKIPSVFVHGAEDASISVDDTKSNYVACAAPKELIIVEGCGHTTAAVRGEAPEKIHNFINKYL